MYYCMKTLHIILLVVAGNVKSFTLTLSSRLQNKCVSPALFSSNMNQSPLPLFLIQYIDELDAYSPQDAIYMDTKVLGGVNLPLLIFCGLTIAAVSFVGLALSAVKKAEDVAKRSVELRSVDDSFIFDGDETSSSVTPTYLLSAILAGLQYLPPEKILKENIQLGRTVQYKLYRKILPKWDDLIRSPSTLGAVNKALETFESISCATINCCVDVPAW